MSNLVIFCENNNNNQKKSPWGSPHTPPQAGLFLPVCRVACHPDRGGRRGRDPSEEEEEEEEEEFFHHYKNNLERHAHTPSGVAGADLKSQSGGALRTPPSHGGSAPL